MLENSTDPGWLPTALADFDRVLIDHAHCEKKAAATAMALVAAYPERSRLVRQLSALALEEIRHFRAVHEQICARGLVFGRDPGDRYAQALLRLCRNGREERLTDRLLISGLIEARSHERLNLLAEALPDPELQLFYRFLARAEAGHAELFRDLALTYADSAVTHARLGELALAEAQILASLPIEPRIH